MLLLEDHTDTRIWLKDLLMEALDGIAVLEAETIGEAKVILEGNIVNLALLDINLPDGSGIDLARDITAASNDTYIVMTTIFDDDKHLFAALQAGAKGYLLKEQPRTQLIQHIQGILKGEPPLSPSIARRILTYFQDAPVQKSDSCLSKREEEVLTLAAKGYKTKEISKMLEISLNTTAGYLKSIYKKLNISSRAEATLEATKLGLVKPD
ncbi:MAG: response regulator transcription factor [Halioglobus sp.]|nr:response regulator transcription factor [Halioglobus sp.]